jgi:hypothetical protein
VRPLADWIAQIKRAFDLFPQVDYIGGKVLPKWNMPPPLWLKPEHWAPLALVDYGDEPFYTSAQRPVNFPTANLAVRRDAFKRAGLFSPEFPRSQDREFQLRLLQAGRLGLYAPAIRVIADVQNERLEKRYHHKWYRVTGRFHSDMRLCDMTDRQGHIVEIPHDRVTLFGTPASFYRELLRECRLWALALLQREENASLNHYNRIQYWIGYISRRYERTSAELTHSRFTEIAAFTKRLLLKKLSRRSGMVC